MKSSIKRNRLSTSTLKNLEACHYDLFETIIGPDGVLGRRHVGFLQGLPSGEVLYDSLMLQARSRGGGANQEKKTIFTDTDAEATRLSARIGQTVATALESRDETFFQQLLEFVRATKQKKRIGSLRAKKVGVVRQRGRATAPWTLSQVVPVAVFLITQKRVKALSEHNGNFTDLPIGREEFRDAVRDCQEKSGLENPPEISNAELLR